MMRTLSLAAITEEEINERLIYTGPFMKAASMAMDRCHPVKKHHSIRKLKERQDELILEDPDASLAGYGHKPVFDPQVYIQIWNNIVPHAAIVWLNELKMTKHYESIISVTLSEDEWVIHKRAMYDDWEDVTTSLREWEQRISSAARDEMEAIKRQIGVIEGSNPNNLRILQTRSEKNLQKKAPPRIMTPRPLPQRAVAT